MTYTLETIIDNVETNIHTQEDYNALSQEIRDLYETAKEIQYKRQMSYNELCQREDEERAIQAEQARLQAIWDAVDRGCSESPDGTW